MLSEDNFRTLERHADYYIFSADLSILVENTQFRVHRYFFERESNWFAGRLTTPASPGAKPQGSDDSTAIILEDLSSEQFAKFLWVFYNKHYSLYDAPVEDWVVILTLANRWSFAEVKNLAIRELEKKDMLDVQRIKLYHANQVDPNYLIPRYAALCEREEPLTEEEGLDLGMHIVIKITTAREHARIPSGAMSPRTPTIHGPDLQEVVRKVFKIVPRENGPTSEKTANTTGALKTPPTQQPTSSPPTQRTPKVEQKASTNSSKSQRKQGPKKEKEAVIGTGTAQPPTTATPQKPVATPTPTPTKTPQVPLPWPVAKEPKQDNTTPKETKRAEEDVAGQKEEEGGAGTGSSSGPAPPTGSTDVDPLLDLSTTSSTTNQAAAGGTTHPDSADSDDPLADLLPSPPSLFGGLIPSLFDQQSSGYSPWNKNNLF